MSQVNFYRAPQFPFSKPDLSLFGVIAGLSLTTGLVCVLDAGDSSSYGGSGQTFADDSAASNDFYLGPTSSSEAQDPTFNGTAGGLSSAEYFSVDGADYFRKVTANTTAIDNLHKDGAKFCSLIGMRTPTTYAALPGVMATSNNTGASYGVDCMIHTTGAPRIDVSGGATALSKTSDTTLSTGTDHMLAWNIDENGGAVSFFWLDGAYNQVSSSNLFDANYTSPSASAATNKLEWFAAGGGNRPMGADARLYFAALWEGTIPTKADLDNIHAKIGPRIGV